eukprot:3373239-Pleurochrysis_carterae.AAC.1
MVLSALYSDAPASHKLRTRAAWCARVSASRVRMRNKQQPKNQPNRVPDMTRARALGKSPPAARESIGLMTPVDGYCYGWMSPN